MAAMLMHVLLYRLRPGAVATLTPYSIGLGLLIWAVRGSAYPLTAAVLYALLVAGYLLFFLSYLNDAESPSAKVLEIVHSHGPLSEAGVASHFTNEELIGMRTRRLIGSGWITKKGSTFAPTRRGAFIAGMVYWYRHLLGWDDGG